MTRTILLLIAIIALPVCCCAQSIPHTNYTTRDGLISDRVTAITQDERGVMWFGSYFGICRYDGIKFERIDLPEPQQNKYVHCLLAANDKLYAGFSFGGGIAEYDHGKIIAHLIPGSSTAVNNDITCLAKAKDSAVLLCNTANQVFRLKDGSFRWLFNISAGYGQVNTMFEDRQGRVWLGTENGMIIVEPGYTTARVYDPAENFQLLQHYSEMTWYCRSNGVTTSIGILSEVTGGRLYEDVLVSRPLIPNYAAGASFHNGLWLAGAGPGLSQVAPSGKLSTHNVPLDLSTDIKALYIDREDNIWIANEPGVLKVSNLSIQTFLFDEMALGGGSMARQSDSSLWISNSHALYRVTDHAIQKLDFPHGNDMFGLLHVDDNNRLWIGQWNAGLWITRWKENVLRSKKMLLSFDQVSIKAQCMAEDHQGNTWIGGMNGLFRIRNEEVVERYQPKNAGGFPAFITSMALDEKQQVLWLGDNAGGVIRLEYAPTKEGSAYNYTGAAFVSTADGLTDKYIRSMQLDKTGRLWVGTRFGGIYSITAKDGHYLARNQNTASQLSCTRITSIMPQDSTAVWFSSCDGIFQYDVLQDRWRHYGVSDGLLNAEIYQVLPDVTDKVVWALSTQGLTRIPYDTVVHTALPPVQISAVTVLGKEDRNALGAAATPTYNYKQNSIGFSFSANSFIDEKSVRYKYKLDGFDKDWSSPVSTSNINYASLPPGDYSFSVMAQNARGLWSSKPATFSFRIIRPFYKAPLFIFGMLLLAILIMYVLNVQRLKHRYKIEKLRLSIARDLHDDVGSTLGSINLLSQTASRRLENNVLAAEVYPVFKKIGDSAETTLDAMDDIVWAINPEKDKMFDLLIRMREFAIPLLEARDLRFSFKTEGDPQVALPMNLRRNTFLIFKEAIYNILKHAQASEVEIVISLFSSRLHLIVTDNGKGFPAGEKNNRNGLKNMQARAAQSGGNIQVFSTGKGTSIEFVASIR